MTHHHLYRALAGLCFALSLAACGGNNASNDQGKQTLPGVSDSATSADESTLPGPGQVVENASSDDSTESYNETAKSFRPVGLTGTTTRQVVVERNSGTAPDPQIFTLSTASRDEQAIMSQTLSSVESDGSSKRVRTGFGRRLSLSGSTKSDSTATSVQKAASTASLSWKTLSTGWKVAAFGVQSPGAKGMRVGLRVDALPNKALVRFYSPSASTMVQLLGAEVASAIAAKANDPEARGKGLFWGSVTAGDTSIIEVALPPDTSVDAVQLGIDQVVHMIVTQEQVANKAVYDYEGLDYAGPCQQNAVCTIGSSPSVADAVLQLSLLEYDSYGLAGSYMCTGTLIGDNASSGIPYVLTADHCVSSQAQASDMLATAFFRTSSCGASSLDGRAVDFWGRWEYLFSERKPGGTDISLLRMNLWQALPNGILLAGWDAAYVSSTNVSSFHHASGSPLKVSTGAATTLGPLFLKVNWTGQGTTEPGSSGAALFNENQQVIGTLWGGFSACASGVSGSGSLLDYGNGQPDYYGRFSLAYARGLRRWLNLNAQQVWSAADLDGDGHKELLFRAPVKGGLGLRTYVAGKVDADTGEITAWRVIDAGLAMTDETPEALAVVDVDSDGREDVVFKAKEADGTYAIRMLTMREETVDGNTSLVAYAPTLWDKLSGRIRLVGVGRVNDDEIADLVLTDLSASSREIVTILLHPNSGYPGEFLGERYVEPLNFDGYVAVGVGNFVDDDKAEVLFRLRATPNSGLLVGWNASGGYDTANAKTVRFGSSAGTFIAMADLNGDGYLDLLGESFGRLYYNLVQKNDSDLSIRFVNAGMSLPSRPSNSVLASLSDVDGDMVADQVWRRPATGEVFITRSASGANLQLQPLSVAP